MYYNITNDSQKTWTESGNMTILLQISKSILDTLVILIFLGFYTSELNSSRSRMTQLKIHT